MGYRSDAVEISVFLGYAPRHWMIDVRQKRQCGLSFKGRMSAEDETTSLSQNIWNRQLTRRHIQEKLRRQQLWYSSD
jgi:hypothetical protein